MSEEKRRCLKLPKRLIQNCPLCGEPQIICMRGLTRDLENSSVQLAYDKGYSFCNCRNIFFTDWENIDKRIYDETYLGIQNCKENMIVFEHASKKAWSMVERHIKEPKTFFEIGACHDLILNQAKCKGMEVTGLDLIPRKSEHNIINDDFEHYEPIAKYDIVWASHVFEHFKDPKNAVLKCISMLNENGILYVSMPDTIYINFNAIEDWDWHVREHHILWNVYNWIEFVEELGLKCLESDRSTDTVERVKDKDKGYFWIQEAKSIFGRPDAHRSSGFTL